MKQKQHSTEAIICILRQSEGDETVESICRVTTSPKRRSIVGSSNTATWIWLMPNDLKELEKNDELKKMLAESLLKNRVLEAVNAKKWCARCRRNMPLSMW